jgi:hypothetical protein
MVYSKNISVALNKGVETATKTPVAKIRIESSFEPGDSCKSVEKDSFSDHLSQFP